MEDQQKRWKLSRKGWKFSRKSRKTISKGCRTSRKRCIRPTGNVGRQQERMED